MKQVFLTIAVLVTFVLATHTQEPQKFTAEIAYDLGYSNGRHDARVSSNALEEFYHCIKDNPDKQPSDCWKAAIESALKFDEVWQKKSWEDKAMYYKDPEYQRVLKSIREKNVNDVPFFNWR